MAQLGDKLVPSEWSSFMFLPTPKSSGGATPLLMLLICKTPSVGFDPISGRTRTKTRMLAAFSPDDIMLVMVALLLIVPLLHILIEAQEGSRVPTSVASVA